MVQLRLYIIDISLRPMIDAGGGCPHVEHDPKMRIMIIDDDEEIREVISVLLSNEDYEVI